MVEVHPRKDDLFNMIVEQKEVYGTSIEVVSYVLKVPGRFYDALCRCNFPLLLSFSVAAGVTGILTSLKHRGNRFQLLSNSY